MLVDTVLPFGLHSAPKMFNAVADAMEWVVRKNHIRKLCHYLNDFLAFGSLESGKSAQSLSALFRWASEPNGLVSHWH